jgi:hypothetical protein
LKIRKDGGCNAIYTTEKKGREGRNVGRKKRERERVERNDQVRLVVLRD